MRFEETKDMVTVLAACFAAMIKFLSDGLADLGRAEVRF